MSFAKILEKYKIYGEYRHLYYARDVKRYGNLYSKFYFFETLLRDQILTNKVINKQKLYDLLNQAVKHKVITKDDSAILRKARNTLFHFEEEELELPIAEERYIKYEKILDNIYQEICTFSCLF